MKFLLRCLLVLAIAVGAGLVLYYAVQALPGNSPAQNPPSVQRPPDNGNPPAGVARPEGSENNRSDGIRLRSVAGVVGKTVLFAVIVVVAVIAKNLIFERKKARKQTD